MSDVRLCTETQLWFIITKQGLSEVRITRGQLRNPSIKKLKKCADILMKTSTTSTAGIACSTIYRTVTDNRI